VARRSVEGVHETLTGETIDEMVEVSVVEVPASPPPFR
jgi:hypothetical protein